jgi:hypothetical protein
MGQCHRPESDQAICTLAQTFVEPVGAADSKGERRCTASAQFGYVARKLFAGEVRAVFIQRPKRAAFGKQRGDAQRLVNLAIIGAARAAFGNFASVDWTEPSRAARRADALAVASHKLPFRAGFQPADAENLKAHDLSNASDDAPLTRTIDAPHLFEIVELANLGTEDVDNDVVGVDEDPVAMR